MGKGNEDLKAKIAKIQMKGKAPAMPSPSMKEDMHEEADDRSMEELEEEYEAKKKALMDKIKETESQEEQEQEEPLNESKEVEKDAELERAIIEYSDEGKFRVELIYQLVQMNNNLNGLMEAFKGLVNND